MARIEHSSRSRRLEAFRSLSQQTGLELRSVVALASVNRLGILFDSSGTLRRINTNDPAVARRYLNDRRRHWAEHRGTDRAVRAQTEVRAHPEARISVYRQCPACGNGVHRDGPTAGGGGSTCQRCGASLVPDARYPCPDFPTMSIVSTP
jgi:hypothetical protein